VSVWPLQRSFPSPETRVRSPGSEVPGISLPGPSRPRTKYLIKPLSNPSSGLCGSALLPGGKRTERTHSDPVNWPQRVAARWRVGGGEINPL